MNGTFDFNGRSEGFDALSGSGTVTNNATGSFSLMTLGNGNGSSTFSGVIRNGLSGGTMALAKTGTGTLTLAGSNDYTGGTTVSAGTLRLGSSTALPASGVVTDNGVLDLNSYGISIPTLNGTAGTITDNSASGGATTLTVTNSGNFAGTISDGTTKVALSLNAPGTLILSGSNDYTGGTTVDAGTLYVTNSNALPTGTSLTVGAGGAFVFDSSAGAAPVSSDSLAVLRNATLAAVPEPGTVALLAAGLVTGIGVTWKRRKRG